MGNENSNMSSEDPPMNIEFKVPVPSDIDISQAVTPLNISSIAKNVGILPSELDLYGSYKAKVKLSVLERLKDRKNGYYVVVTGMLLLLILLILAISTSTHIYVYAYKLHPMLSASAFVIAQIAIVCILSMLLLLM